MGGLWFENTTIDPGDSDKRKIARVEDVPDGSRVRGVIDGDRAPR